eukprot:EG_transcript_34963
MSASPQDGPGICLHWVAGSCNFGAQCKFAHPLVLPNGRCVLEGIGPPLNLPRPSPRRGLPMSTRSSCAGCVMRTSEQQSLQEQCEDLTAKLKATERTRADLQARLERESSNAALWTQRFLDCQYDLEAMLRENAALKRSLSVRQFSTHQPSR